MQSDLTLAMRTAISLNVSSLTTIYQAIFCTSASGLSVLARATDATELLRGVFLFEILRHERQGRLLQSPLYHPIKSMTLMVSGTETAKYIHQFPLTTNVTKPSSERSVPKKPMPKILLTREQGRNTIDMIWMIRSERLSW